MAKNNEVSMPVVRRLPRYYRFLGELIKKGTKRVSSRELSEMMGLTASQIRQDLNCFGGFGQQGYGYNVSVLYEEISKILGIDKLNKAVLIGAGNLGSAILSYMDFQSKGFELVGVFDENPEITGKEIAGYKVTDISDLEKVCKIKKPKVAILCVPQTSAQKLADTMISLGIQGFWNFSHFDFNRNYPNVAAENVHLSDSLLTLCFEVNNLN